MTALQGKPEQRLNPRQTRFVAAYLKNGGNAALAYRDAGYKSSTDLSERVKASQLLIRPNVAALVALKQNAIIVRSEDATVASLKELKERLTGWIRGDSFAQDIRDLERNLAEERQDIEDMKKAKAECDNALQRAALTMAIADTRKHATDYEVEIKRLKVAHARESNQANQTLLKTKGALDPSRKPHGPRSQVVEGLMLALVKNDEGPGLKAKMEASTPIDV